MLLVINALGDKLTTQCLTLLKDGGVYLVTKDGISSNENEFQSQIQKKLSLLGSSWIRDLYVVVDEVFYEFSNRDKGKTPLNTYLKKNGVLIKRVRNIKLQGGHTLVDGDFVLFATSAAFENENKNELELDEKKVRHLYSLKASELEHPVLKRFEFDLSKVFPSKKVLSIASIKALPWSYHLDMLFLKLGDGIIAISDPLALKYYQNKLDVNLKTEITKVIKYYEEIILGLGYRVVRLPTLFAEDEERIYTNEIIFTQVKPQRAFLSFCNSILLRGSLYLPSFESWREHEAYNESLEVIEGICDSFNLKAKFITFPRSLEHTGGFLKCLSLMRE